MKYIKDHENLSQKKVLLRLDLNVPLKNGIITDQTRIDKILPIINFLLDKNSPFIVKGIDLSDLILKLLFFDIKTLIIGSLDAKTLSL